MPTLIIVIRMLTGSSASVIVILLLIALIRSVTIVMTLAIIFSILLARSNSLSGVGDLAFIKGFALSGFVCYRVWGPDSSPKGP